MTVPSRDFKCSLIECVMVFCLIDQNGGIRTNCKLFSRTLTQTNKHEKIFLQVNVNIESQMSILKTSFALKRGKIDVI